MRCRSTQSALRTGHDRSASSNVQPARRNSARHASGSGPRSAGDLPAPTAPRTDPSPRAAARPSAATPRGAENHPGEPTANRQSPRARAQPQRRPARLRRRRLPRLDGQLQPQRRNHTGHLVPAEHAARAGAQQRDLVRRHPMRTRCLTQQPGIGPSPDHRRRHPRVLLNRHQIRLHQPWWLPERTLRPRARRRQPVRQRDLRANSHGPMITASPGPVQHQTPSVGVSPRIRGPKPHGGQHLHRGAPPAPSARRAPPNVIGVHQPDAPPGDTP